MEDAGVGWITAIIVGGIAGWLAEQFMKSYMGLIVNIVLGIVGAAIASAILSAIGINLVGWIGYLISGFIGAVLLILDRPGRTTGLRTVPTIGKWDKWPSYSVVGSRAFGDGRSAIMRTPTETTCHHSARTFKLRRGVRSGMGIPLSGWVACSRSTLQ
jgi:uncharacterized membrane protein YeaQ/YmgE (transglycosylase-associated protein family)